PQVPYGITVSEIGTTSCAISWKINGPKPGKTNFTVMLMADSPATSKEFTVTGFDIRYYLAEGLEEYWSYNVTVTAVTNVGAKTSNRVHFRTRPTAPGKVSDLKITEAPRGVYTWMQISWRAPAVLFWNSIIKEYGLDISTSDRNATTQSLSHENDENHDYTVVVNVVPEETYTFKVYATNSLDMKGEVSTVVKQAPAGVPVNIEDTLQVDIISLHQMKNVEDRQFTVTLVEDFFEESTNGQIQASGLIACAKDCNFEGIKTLADFNTMDNWQDASQRGYTLYRVTNPAWMDKLQTQCTCGRSKRVVTNVEYTVGSDECSNTPQKQYCNGPLKSGTSYKLVAVSCTNGGCLLSQVYGPFVTAAKEQSDDGRNCSTESIIIGVVLGFTNLLLLVYAGYTTLIIRRNRVDKDGLKMSTSNKYDRKSQTYVNESFMVGVAGAGGSVDLETFSNAAPGRESENEYSRLDENTREDRTTYDIIQRCL
ncbi:tyrosine-protein phosphatase 10D-like, partial [Mercenaria mercenaria]|uniref:tyrosine-protein phosphatase 10D-like n=1 Tax=Mercenaria mercenaria TaxID=6596 RepID=UPI00234F733A